MKSTLAFRMRKRRALGAARALEQAGDHAGAALTLTTLAQSAPDHATAIEVSALATECLLRAGDVPAGIDDLIRELLTLADESAPEESLKLLTRACSLAFAPSRHLAGKTSPICIDPEAFMAPFQESPSWTDLTASGPPRTTSPRGDGPLSVLVLADSDHRFSRPLIDATGVRAMPQAGAIFIRPVVTTHNSIGTATQNTTITASQFEINDVQITKTIQGGYVEISEAAIDWSQPEALGPLLDDMMRVYMDRTDLLACSELQTGTTNSNNFANASIADPAYWVEWMYTAAADILTGSNGNLPSVLAVSPNVWKLMGSLSDTADRPLFPQVGPMNAYGSLNVASTQGAFAFGLRVVVDRNLTSAGMTILDPRALESFELNKGLISVEQPSQLSRQIAVRGYWASKVVSPELSIKAAFV